MRRFLAVATVLAVAALVAVGCGGGGVIPDAPSDTSAGSEPARGGPVGQADATACAANRTQISAAAQRYQAVEGVYPPSLQSLVPTYFQSVPVCPGGGTYTLQGYTVTCSVHGS